MMPTRGSRLESFRQHKDHYFGTDDESPLEPADREGFTGLRYFPEDESLKFDLPLDTTGEGIGERLDIPTSAGETKPFMRAGRITFDVGGKPVTLSVFTDLALGRYFLPFTDATSGTKTYTGGRYLDPKPKPSGDLTVDFNYAYNPYCAYGDGWSCPIPPAENALSIPILAGEMLFPRKG